MTKHVAITILLTLLASACSIEPYQTEPTEPTDQNEPNNGTPNQPTEPKHQSCPGITVCDDIGADCFVDYEAHCGGVARGYFVCGDLSGVAFSDGEQYICAGLPYCSSAIEWADDHCADLKGAE